MSGKCTRAVSGKKETKAISSRPYELSSRPVWVALPPMLHGHADLRALVFSAAGRHAANFEAALRSQAFHSNERGALPQEMLLVAAVTAELDADALVESGRARGDSALMLLSSLQRIRAAQGKPPIAFHSLDWTRARWHVKVDNAVALQRLASFPNVTLHDGDATLLLPKVLRRLRGSRVVLFTDGPKGYAGQWLQRLANALPHVVAQFVHDARPGADVRAHMENLVTGLSRDANRDAWPCPTDAFFTDDVAWQRLYGHLDATFATAPAVFPTTTTECCVQNPPRPCFPNSTMGPAIGLTMRRADADASCLRRDPHAATPACGKDGTKRSCFDIKCRPRF